MLRHSTHKRKNLLNGSSFFLLWSKYFLCHFKNFMNMCWLISQDHFGYWLPGRKQKKGSQIQWSLTKGFKSLSGLKSYSLSKRSWVFQYLSMLILENEAAAFVYIKFREDIISLFGIFNMLHILWYSFGSHHLHSSQIVRSPLKFLDFSIQLFLSGSQLIFIIIHVSVIEFSHFVKCTL